MSRNITKFVQQNFIWLRATQIVLNQGFNYMELQKKNENQKKIQKLESKLQDLNQTSILKQKQYNQKSFQMKSQIFVSKMKIQKLQEQNLKKEKKNDQLKKQQQDLKKLLEKLKEQIVRLKQQARKRNDPNYFHEMKQKGFVSFLDQLRLFKFTDSFQKIPNDKYYMVMGQISAGKSSLLNAVTGLQLETGMGDTTTEVQQICLYKYQYGNVHLYDSPGINNEDFSCYNHTTLKLLYTMDEIFVIYSDSLKKIVDSLKILHSIKPNKKMIMIRTKCDLANKQDDKNIEQEIQRDYKYMKNLNIQCQIFAYSTKKQENCFDIKKVNQMIRGNIRFN